MAHGFARIGHGFFPGVMRPDVMRPCVMQCDTDLHGLDTDFSWRDEALRDVMAHGFIRIGHGFFLA